MNSEKVMTIPAEISKSRANSKIKFIIGGLVIVLAVAYLIYTGIQSSAAYFLTIDELYARGETLTGRQIRVSGEVDPATIDYDHTTLTLKFDIMSETGEHLPVIFNGPKPDQMREGAQAIVEGKFDGNTFHADTLLLKCPSRYDADVIEEVQVDSYK